MLSKISAATIIGIEACLVQVEVDAAKGLPGETIVGLPDVVVRESKNRVKSAIKHSGYRYPLNTYVINLAPAELKKEGPLLDLPIAISILQSTNQIQIPDDMMIVGELSLDGEVKPVRGIIAIAQMAQKKGYTYLVVPAQNKQNAELVDGITIVPIGRLTDLAHFIDTGDVPEYETQAHDEEKKEECALDYSEVRGQSAGKRAMEICAAGGHNVLLVGPPGTGKTLLIRRLTTVLPELSAEEHIETSKIHSLSHIGATRSLDDTKRPFRAPHHSISYAGLAGGGANPMPGEISLAHNGVLFLDELPEFRRDVIEVLRQPLEDRHVHLSRSRLSVTYPADFIFAAAMNPCPCGYFGDSQNTCRCSKNQIHHYWRKVSGPLLDRIDLIVEIPRIETRDLLTPSPTTSPLESPEIRDRVADARIRQNQRSQSGLNTHLGVKEIDVVCQLSDQEQQLSRTILEKGWVSGRSYHKLLKVARTIADLDKKTRIEVTHLLEAVQYRKIGKYTES